MTKILSARDLLELVRQQDVEDRAAEEVSESTRGRRIYSINQRTRAPARASVEQRLPMVEAESDDFDLHKTLELQLPTPPAKPKPQVVYDIAPTSPLEATARGATRDPRSDDFDEPAPSSRRRPPTFQKTLEMQLEDVQAQRPHNRTVEMRVPSAPTSSPSAPLPPVAPTPPVAPVAPQPPVPPVRPTAPQAPVAPVTAARGPRNTQKLGVVRPDDDPGLAALAAELNASAQTVNRVAEQSRSLSPRAFQRVQAPVPVVPRDEPADDSVDEADPASPGRAGRRPSVQGWARKMTPADSPRADTLPEIATDEAFRSALELASAPTPARKSERPEAKSSDKTTGWSPGRSKRSSRPPPRPREPAPVEEAEPESLTEPIALTGDETLVLLNYDQAVPLEEVAERTGLTTYRVSTILGQLLDRGVISEVAPDAIGRSAPGRKAPAEQRTYEIEDEFLSKPMPSLEQMADEADLPATLADVDLPANVVRDDLPAKVKSAPRAGVSEPAGPATTRDASSAEASPESGNGGGRAPPASGEKLKGTAAKEADDDEIIGDEAPSSSGPDEDLDPRSMAAAANYQRHYELVLAKKTTDERAHIAATGTPADLFALCFDKEPGVIRALWENASLDSEHARFASFHHRTALGLERLFERSDFARDIQVQRRLIRNPLLSEPLLRRLLMPKRLIDIYKVMLDRDVPERTRTSTRGILRTKYANTEPEDRVQLIWNTEGRVLQYLTGLTIDSKCASIICGRAVVSVMLVQSFCKFAATPPSVIHHCLKQPMIRRQLHLRNMLLKHPNCPSEAKRAF